MRDLNYQLKMLCKHSHEGSFETRVGRERQLSAIANQLHDLGSLIPGGRQYIEQLRIYERHTANAGLSKMHGLRHAYAQQRYRELTGWHSPHGGGPSRAQLTKSQRDTDQLARLTISEELGHVRGQITAVYIGR